MRIRWRDFEIPNSVVCEEETKSSTYGRFIVEPFERGIGVTVGNSLRRILLSSIEGAAVVSAKIGFGHPAENDLLLTLSDSFRSASERIGNGEPLLDHESEALLQLAAADRADSPVAETLLHELTSVAGIHEDVTDIILNLKNLLVSLHDTDEAELRIRVDTKGPVTNANIECGPEVEVMNTNLHIATLTQDIPFHVDLRARKGRGFSTAEENSGGDNEIGVVWMDSSFSPVSRVRYKIENTRAGQKTNYDRLILEVWTDGTMSPEKALVEASKIMRRHLDPFIQYSGMGYALSADAVPEEVARVSPDNEELRRKLEMPVSALDLSVRAYNCLDGETIKTVGDLVQWKEPDLLKVRNFGKTTLIEIQQKLRDLGLDLGMNAATLESRAGTSSSV